VVELKRRQLQELGAALEARRARGEVRVDRAGRPDRESAALMHQIQANQRPLEMDEKEQRVGEGGGKGRGWWGAMHVLGWAVQGGVGMRGAGVSQP
jgi:hypothetical protein